MRSDKSNYNRPDPVQLSMPVRTPGVLAQFSDSQLVVSCPLSFDTNKSSSTLIALQKPLGPQDSCEYNQWPTANSDMLFYNTQELEGA